MAEKEGLQPLTYDSENIRNRMISKLVKTDAHFRHQQRGEPDLTQEEKSSIAHDILNKSPGLFLERFSKYLTFDDTHCFKNEKGDYRVDFYIEEIFKRSTDSRHNVVKNRRFQALQKLMDEGEYFSEIEMKWRDPLLYEQMVGQYASESEKAEEMEQDIDKSDLRLSSILLKHMDMQTNKHYYELQKEKEEGQEEEEEEEESDEQIVEEDTDEENESDNKRHQLNSNVKKEKNAEDTEVSETERNYFRSEFLRIMQEQFLSGEDTNFDYSKVDNNTDYDSLDIVGHDAEEKYFDADEESNNDCINSDATQRNENWQMSSEDNDRDVTE